MLVASAKNVLSVACVATGWEGGGGAEDCDEAGTGPATENPHSLVHTIEKASNCTYLASLTAAKPVQASCPWPHSAGFQRESGFSAPPA